MASIGLGLGLILLGWFGASGSAREFEQIPYLISGGILGLALVILGATLCVLAALRDLVGMAVGDAGLTLNGGQVPVGIEAATEVVVPVGAVVVPPTVVASNHDSNSEHARSIDSGLVVTAKGTMLHRSDCPVVAERAGLRPAPADHAALRPCRMCLPAMAGGAVANGGAASP